MKVICDNCRAVYKIPDEKLVKPVNKATCRKCGHRMLIPRPRQGAGPDEKTLVTAVPPTPPPAPQREVVHDRPTTPLEDEPENTMPGVGSGTPLPGPGRRVAGPIDDVPLFAATPMPTADRTAQPQMKVRMTPAPPPARRTPPTPARREPVRSVPPAPDLSYGGSTPEPPPRSRTPQPPPRAPEPPPPARSAQRPPPEPRYTEPRQPEPRYQEQPRHATPHHEPRHATPQHDPRGISPAQDYREPAPSRRTPAPAPAAAMPQPAPLPSSYPTAPSQASHDPAGDLVLAMLGTAGAMLGALVLVGAFATTAAALPISTLVMLGLGSLLAFGGGMSTLLVIVTGGRGRRPARPLVSLVLGSGMGLFVTASAVGLFVAKDQWLQGGGSLPVAFGTAAPSDGDAAVLAASTPDAPPVETVAAAIPDPATAAGAVAAADAPAATEAPPETTTSSKASTSTSSKSGSSEPKAQTFEPRSTSSTSKSSSGTSTSKSSTTSSKSTGSSDIDDILADDPPPKSTSSTTSSKTSGSSAAASDLPESVPDDVIDTILRNNLDLKKCFFNHKKATGTLPSRVTVGFTLEPSGKITGAGVTDAEYAATELDSCLSKALQSIAMPPSSGAARKVKYPFQLQ